MGYYADSTYSNAQIKIENEEALKQALKTWVASGEKSWVRTGYVLNANDVLDIICECRYDTTKDDKYIYIDCFNGEKWATTDDELPHVIAPFVEDGGRLEFKGEDDYLWRFLFNDKQCVKQLGRLEEVWD